MHKRRIFKFFRYTVSMALALSMLLGDIGSSLGIAYAKEATGTQVEEEYTEAEVNASNAEKYGLAENIKDGVILHAFCWSFNSIKENMKDIAEAGFTTVQTSPANKCNDSHPQKVLWSDDSGNGGSWWWHYQPTDWTVGNYQLGTEEEYKAMCEEADKYGVKIITDVLPNHTANDTSKVAQNLINSAGGKLYHDNGFNQIQNWGNRWECTTGMMNGLPDVNTENQGFQEYYLKYCNELISLGCDGFRYDTSKHIGVPSDPKDSANTRGVNDFWDVATGKKAVNGVSLDRASEMYIYGEVLQGDNVPTAEYANYMDQTASSYGGTLRSAIKYKNFGVNNISNWQHTNPDKIVTWVESHDTYCNEHESAGLSNWDIKMAWALITARAQGTPLFFSRPNGSDGPSGNYWGYNVLGAKGNDHFKDPEVAAVNKFRTAMIGQGEYLRNPNGNQQILQIDRGTKGTCIINLGDSTSINNDTTMADGTYTDQVSGRTFTVSGGKISGQLDGGKVAVIYNAKASTDPKVSVSAASGSTFTDKLDLTITVSNATSATYSVNGGASVSFNDKATITIGENASYDSTITVKVVAKNAEGTTEKTYKYTKVDPNAVCKAQIVLPSGWSEPVCCYAYDSATEKITNGEWPGVKMTKVAGSSNLYEYTIPNNIEKPRVVFYSSDTNRTPADMEKGHLFESKGTYRYENGDWKKVVAATVPPTVPPTDPPTDPPTATPTVIANEMAVIASLESGASFTTETAEVKLTLQNAEKGTYTVDDGPVKEFTGSVNVVIGKGKIADSDVTVKTTATGNGKTVEKTFTYRKEYLVEHAINVAAEELEEVVVNAAAETGGVYATNPNGKVGKQATITIDGDCSDWSSDMLIAQGGAWDVPNTWKGAHEDCLADCYGLYAAWDDTNLYLGLEFVNTTDTWQTPGNASLSNSGKMGDIPIVVALNVGNRTATSGKMESAAGQAHPWGLNVEFETRVDNILIMSGKPGLGTPGYFIAKSDGKLSYDADYCLSFKTEGINYKMADNSVSSELMQLVNSKSVSDAYDASKYQDAVAAGHSRTYDSFYEINIPLKTLGVTKAELEANGIGAMVVGTRGESAMDCVPHDPSVLDNVEESYSQDPSTSAEKEDLDVITVPLASIGKSGPQSIITTTPTKVPTDTPTVTPTIVPGGNMMVNFGADRSAPQYNTTTLNIKAIVAGGIAPYNYEFFVDGQSVQNSVSDSYVWQNGTAGARKIKVVVTDSTGKTLTCEKDYDLEQKGGVINTPTPSIGINPTATPIPSTATPTPTPIVVQPGKLGISKFTVSGLKYVGDEVVLRAEAVNATGTPLYMFAYEVNNGEEIVIQKYSESNEARFKLEEAGKYTLKVYVVDANDGALAFGEIANYVVTKKSAGNSNQNQGENSVSSSVINGADVTGIPNKGTVVYDSKSKAEYKVTSTGSTKAVEYVKAPTKNTTITVPDTIKIGGISYKVRKISDNAFKNNKTVKTVTIGKNVITIGKSAFQNCTALQKVKKGSYVQTIGDKAFYGCKKLSSITLSSKLTTIGKYAFYKCISLKKVTIPSKVKKIGTKAFYGCKKLKTITIKTKKLNSKNVGSKAFKGIYSKATIKVPGSKVTSYKKLLMSKGVSSNAKVKKY